MYIPIIKFTLIYSYFLVFVKQSKCEECASDLSTKSYNGSCRNTTVLDNSCTVPSLPSRAEYFHPDLVVEPGIQVPPDTHLWIRCRKNHAIVGSDKIICRNKIWSSNFGRCLRKCPPVRTTNQRHATCFFENRKLSNCSEPVEGTLVKYECNNFYKLDSKPTQICLDGTWDQPAPKCVSTCGQNFVDAQPLIVNGTTAKRNRHPWQIALYQGESKQFICGGTLIKPTVILTGAVCFGEEENVKLELYTVAAGTQYRLYNHSRDRHEAQFSKLKQVFRPEQYRGEQQNYAGDIAVAITTKPFVLNRAVFPVCVDWNWNWNKNEIGYITGWGLINNISSADELQELEVPIKSPNCVSELNEDFQKYFTFDKFCAGYANQSGKAASKGDSGGGLIVKHNDRYYIAGILSVCPWGDFGGCDDHYALYTNVSSYIDFIRKKTINEDIYETENNALNYSPSSFIKLESCPSVPTTSSRQASCIVDNEISDCRSPAHGSIALFSCAPFYEIEKSPSEIFRTCINGSWNLELPSCSPVCGIKSGQAQTLIVGGDDVKKGSIPWQAALYKLKEDNQWKFSCGATMIHKNMFITAAHCVTYLHNYSPIPKNLFTIAVGKHYRIFNDTRDPHAQFSTLTEIFIPSQYQGYIQNYYGDIALLKTEKEFTLSLNVKPVCLDWHGKFELKSHQYGAVTGWGVTETGNLSEELKILEVPYIDKGRCRKLLDFDYQPYITFDKMCSGFLNQSKSACKGDSGSGLVFKDKTDGKHYIMGVVSLAPQAPDGGCNIQEYTLYTDVSFYVNNFIKTNAPQYGHH